MLLSLLFLLASQMYNPKMAKTNIVWLANYPLKTKWGSLIPRPLKMNERLSTSKRQDEDRKQLLAHRNLPMYPPLQRLLNDNLEAMAKQLYDYWFVQFDFPNEDGKPYKSSGGKMVWNEKLKREIPEGWRDGCFSDIANITMGQSPDGSSYNKDGEGEIFYQGSTDFGIRFPSVRMYTTAPARFAKQGDILMSVRAPIGAVNIANTDCCIGRGLSAINSKIESMTYIYFVIHYLKVRFSSLNSVGTTFGAITKDDLYGLPVVVPSRVAIKMFGSISKPIFDKQMNMGKEIENLTKQRDELLPLLMNGQVSVNYHLSHD
jgi:type I restriction enzyme S subunit